MLLLSFFGVFYHLGIFSPLAVIAIGEVNDHVRNFFFSISIYCRRFFQFCVGCGLDCAFACIIYIFYGKKITEVQRSDFKTEVF